ncbi:MAG TPA: response regulator [Myxococcota bacterium]|jgi:CheY-like chemotaxis protein|nr:response regulator [Myxococcota bacterium]
MPPFPPRVLVAEDDHEMRSLLVATLRRDGCVVEEAVDGADLLARLSAGFDLVISDVRMPGLTGLEVLARLRRAGGSTPFILITAFGDADLHAEARRVGTATVFDKPFDLDDLRTVAQISLARRGASRG